MLSNLRNISEQSAEDMLRALRERALLQGLPGEEAGGAYKPPKVPKEYKDIVNNIIDRNRDLGAALEASGLAHKCVPTLPPVPAARRSGPESTRTSGRRVRAQEAAVKGATGARAGRARHMQVRALLSPAEAARTCCHGLGPERPHRPDAARACRKKGRNCASSPEMLEQLIRDQADEAYIRSLKDGRATSMQWKRMLAANPEIYKARWPSAARPRSLRRPRRASLEPEQGHVCRAQGVEKDNVLKDRWRALRQAVGCSNGDRCSEWTGDEWLGDLFLGEGLAKLIGRIFEVTG